MSTRMNIHSRFCVDGKGPQSTENEDKQLHIGAVLEGLVGSELMLVGENYQMRTRSSFYLVPTKFLLLSSLMIYFIF